MIDQNSFRPGVPARTFASTLLQAALVVGVVVSLLLRSQQLRAEILNFTFSGMVTEMDNAEFALDNSIAVGTPFRGFLIFDSSTPDSESDPTVGHYWHTNAVTGIVIRAGNYVFRTNPQYVNFVVEAVDRADGDGILFHSYNNVCSRPLLVYDIDWQLSDSSGAALTNDSLPTIPPKLTTFSQDFGLSVNGGDRSSGYFIRGNVTNVTVAPFVIPERPATTIRDAVELSWPSALGYFYQPQMSADMTNWVDFGEPILGDGTVISKFVPRPPGTNMYFRAEIANHL